MKYILATCLFFGFISKPKAQCIQELFIYSPDSSKILSNFYIIQADSETFFFGWDDTCCPEDDSIFYHFVINGGKKQKTVLKKIIAVPVWYEYQAESLANCLFGFIYSQGLNKKQAIKKITNAYRVSDSEDEFYWIDDLELSLW